MTLAASALSLRPRPGRAPLYRDLAAQVRRAVGLGALRPGDRLPAPRPAAVDLVVSPDALARAYRALEYEGVVVGAGDFDAAAEIQQRLLPADGAVIAGTECAGICRPVFGVGGDYYDFIRLSETVLAVAIADVCGKGMPAALLMATLRAYVRGQAVGRAADLAAVAATLNRLVYECSPSNRYAAFFYGEYDRAAQSLTYVNAGHLPPLVARFQDGRDQIVRLDPTGPVAGLMAESSYAERRVALEPGDVFLAFTDGVSESMNARGDEWGDAGVTAAFGSLREQPAREIARRIVLGADAFAAGAPQHDDITVVAIRVT